TPARTLTVTPATGLGNQVVVASWAGFTPTNGLANQVILVQCASAPTSLDDCAVADPYPSSAAGNRAIGTTTSKGTGTAFFEVRRAAFLPQLDCSETNPCSLVAYENDGTVPPPGQLPATAVVAPLTFARSAADCPPVTNFDVRAEGEASAAQAMYGW